VAAAARSTELRRAMLFNTLGALDTPAATDAVASGDSPKRPRRTAVAAATAATSATATADATVANDNDGMSAAVVAAAADQGRECLGESRTPSSQSKRATPVTSPMPTAASHWTAPIASASRWPADDTSVPHSQSTVAAEVPGREYLGESRTPSSQSKRTTPLTSPMPTAASHWTAPIAAVSYWPSDASSASYNQSAVRATAGEESEAMATRLERTKRWSLGELISDHLSDEVLKEATARGLKVPLDPKP